MDSRPGGERNALEPSRSIAVFRRMSGPLFRRAGIYVVLEVPRRVSGTTQTVTLSPVKLDGELYVVAFGGHTDWALNLRAAGRAKLRRGRRANECAAVEVFDAERDRVIAKLLAVGALKKDYNRRPDAADHPAFRLEFSS